MENRVRYSGSAVCLLRVYLPRSTHHFPDNQTACQALAVCLYSVAGGTQFTHTCNSRRPTDRRGHVPFARIFFYIYDFILFQFIGVFLNLNQYRESSTGTTSSQIRGACQLCTVIPFNIFHLTKNDCRKREREIERESERKNGGPSSIAFILK